MPYLVVPLAIALIIPTIGLGLVALGLSLLAALTVVMAAVALGATGSLMDWILTAIALAANWRAIETGRRLLRRVRASLAG